jgi:LacI family transcriptional regulator
VTLIQKHETPLVVLDRQVPDSKIDVVRGDSEGGAYELTRLLLSLGHRDIAMLNGPRGVSTAEDRLHGYRRALSEARIANNPAREYYGSFTQESGNEMARKALAIAPAPTALFAANNFIGFGVLKSLQELGLRVPEDIAVVSFDDLPSPLVIFPFLTVAAQPAYEMGKKAVEVLLKKLGSSPSEQCQEVVLPIEIVVRQSSGRMREIIQ